MTMSELIDKVNAGECEFKFAKSGNAFVGLKKQSFTPKELRSEAFGFVKSKGSRAFVKIGGMK